MKDLKFCECCGKFISDINNNDYYSHISRKYCSTCSNKIKKQKNLAQVKAYRQRKKQKDNFPGEQLALLQEKNELLRLPGSKLPEQVYN